MGFYSYFRISKPSVGKVPEAEVSRTYRRLRSQTFWGVTVAYSLFYVCRMAMSVVKQPLIDDGILSAGQLGLIGSALLFVYAVGKFVNGFIADYCNIRRFMAWGLFISSLVNLLMGALGLFDGVPAILLFALFAVLWGANGWVQSMGSPPGVISLSRWFPLKERGTWYSIFSATPYLGKFLSFNLIGLVVGWAGWQCGFLFAAACGLVGSLVILLLVSDTPESKGLPSVQELSGEQTRKADTLPVRELQKYVFKHPGIWVIAISSAFIYVTQYAVSGWGVLFLQKGKEFSLESANQIIAFAESFGIAGTVLAGWLSDRLFKGNRVTPVVLSGLPAGPGSLPLHPRRVSGQCRVRLPVQPGDRRGLLHRRRPDGPGHRSAQGHRLRPRHRGDLQLRRRRHPGYRQRIHDPEWQRLGNLRLRPRRPVLDGRLPHFLLPVWGWKHLKKKVVED